MRVVIQGVKKSSVSVNERIFSQIEKGLCCFIVIKCDDNISIKCDDNTEDLKYIKDKIIRLRVFEDDNYNLNKSISDVNVEILLVSQFTLYGYLKKVHVLHLQVL